MAMSTKRIGAPNSYQMELVRGCNMACGFCANYSLPSKKKRYLSVDMAVNIYQCMAELGDKNKVCYAMRGEPTLHPKLNTITSLCRAMLPRFQISIITNGTTMTKTMAADWFSAGGNLLCIDCYSEKMYQRMKAMFDGKVCDYIADRFNPWYYHSPKIRAIILITDIKQYHKLTRKFTNQCDYIPPTAYDKYGIKRVEQPLEKKCVNPFREVDIHWNGDVPLCCKDWLGGRKMFSMAKGYGFKDYWHNDKTLRAARTLLYNRVRTFYPCDRCNYDGGFYQGFLPAMGPVKRGMLASLKEKTACQSLK